MVFSSYLFLFYFLPTALLFYYLVPRRVKHLVLTLVSYVFYGWANPLFSLLLLLSTLIDYLAGLVMVLGGPRAWRQPIQRLDPEGRRTRRQRIALVVSMCANVAMLGFFKYFNFAVDSVNGVVNWLGLPELGLDSVIRVTLPVGISFYTFQSMSYAIDVYRGQATAIKSFIDFACFETMYPQLVAGPIIRFQEVADQLAHRTHTIQKFARGAAFLSLGLAKKVLIANPCGKIADEAFGAGSLYAIDAWYGVTAYAFQIYFDFSGYSDMAIGLGLMLGFMFAKNFDSPYVSQSITEFWRRWHILLSTWLRDYLYIPLGGSRKGPRRTYVNLAIVMLLGGLWHGAAWTFVIWGGLHGLLLAFERARGGMPLYHALPSLVRTSLTFTLVLVTWVFFRAPDVVTAARYLGAMFGMGVPQEGAGLLGGLIYRPYYVGTFAIAALVTWTCPQTWDWTRTLTWRRSLAILLIFGLSVVALLTQAFNPFIYYIF
ncbi:MAG: MBOAT family protein [Acidobacteria bacterium]|nr:MBOAT family protein [Acidobacteriota bacterium]